jgi:hypothetical protein
MTSESTTSAAVGNARAHVLDTARHLVLGPRNNEYGPPNQDFVRTVGALNALGYRKIGDQALEAHDLAIIITVVKLSRLMWSPEKDDSWIDVAGYAACGYECVTLDDGRASGVPTLRS